MPSHPDRVRRNYPEPRISEHDTTYVGIVRWLRGMGYLDAANALAEMHVEDRALRGLPGLVFHE